MRTIRIIAGASVAGLLATGLVVAGGQAAQAAECSTSAVRTSALAGRVTPTTFLLCDDTAGITQAKFYLIAPSSSGGRVFLVTDKTAPFETTVTVPAGSAAVEVVNSSATTDYAFTAGTASTPTPTPTPTPTSTVPTPSTGTIAVSTVAQMEAALLAVRPGQTIEMADGVYMRKGGDRWIAAVDGIATDPITITGSRAAVLSSDSPSGEYGLHILGDHYRVNGITVANASKGIVLDGSVDTVLDGVQVYNVGDEGVHFRACSADGVLRNSYIHDTGLNSPQYGEGVYVGSANSNWSKYNCTDGRDNSENVLIEHNTFRDIAAEGADLKEGTDSGTLQYNLFDNAGYSGENSADSAVDAKGNNWLIHGNTVRNPSGADLDGFQVHAVYTGYGQGNRFWSNVVEGSWPGFGVGLYPAANNQVYCSNSAPGAALGLVGANGKPVACTP